MPTGAALKTALDTISTRVGQDRGLQQNISDRDMRDGRLAAEQMNAVLVQAIDALGVNGDGLITPYELRKISDHIRADPALYADFVAGHGDDEGNIETGFHLVQGDGGTLRFQGRAFVNTVADAIYHVGFSYRDGRFRNEDGDANERIDDIAGWLNYFANGRHDVFGTRASETLHSGDYSGVFAGAENEVFRAEGGHDKIWAGDGNDIIYAGWGDDRAGGGDGNDTLFGGTGADNMHGDDGTDRLFGGDNADILSGGDGRDYLEGGDGGDRLYGGAHLDLIRGGNGADRIGGGGGKDTLWGENGHDEIWGDDDRDIIYGGGYDDRIGGGDDRDWLYGGTGDDRISGDRGNDIIKGSLGRDKLYGGDGDDSVAGGHGADELHGSDGADWLSGEDSNDLIYAGDGADRAFGGDNNDTIYGHDGSDGLFGGTGDDRIDGGDGVDRLYGGDGRDVMRGGDGRDVYYGGKGRDTMEAWERGASEDRFVFNPGDTGVGTWSRDLIEGFQAGVDKIDLTGFGGLRYLGEGTFRSDGQGQVATAGDLVLIDRNGDGQIDALIELRHADDLGRGDFLL